MLATAFESVLTAGRPAILWVEEIDYIAKTKPLFYSFLAQLDRFVGERALVLATTSKLADVDKSLRRVAVSTSTFDSICHRRLTDSL